MVDTETINVREERQLKKEPDVRVQVYDKIKAEAEKEAAKKLQESKKPVVKKKKVGERFRLNDEEVNNLIYKRYNSGLIEVINEAASQEFT